MTSMEPHDVVHFQSPAKFRGWLLDNHSRSEELWVGYWKKGTGRPSMTWEESVDEALCFGWIDGIRRRLDDEAYAIRFTPRRSGSTWSLRNVERFAELDELGRIQPAGRTAYEGRTEEKTGTYSYEHKTAPLDLSDEFTARLMANAVAWVDWEGRPPSYRRKVTYWVMSAKQAATRERRLEKLIDDLAAGKG